MTGYIDRVVSTPRKKQPNKGRKPAKQPTPSVKKLHIPTVEEQSEREFKYNILTANLIVLRLRMSFVRNPERIKMLKGEESAIIKALEEYKVV